MNRTFVLLLTFAGATGAGIAFRHGLHGPATAAVQSEAPRPAALEPSNLDRPAAPDRATGLRFAAAPTSAASDPGELLLARIAHDSGAYLLSRAEAEPGNVRLLKQAAQHFRACLAHEGPLASAGNLFRDARQKLEQSERLLAGATRPPASKVAERPQPKPAPVVVAPAPIPAPAPKAAAPVPTRQMVGPEGIIYERVGDRP